jgi:predicted dehydrogenase/nucleoside-diphosphate-sugar epimerase
MKILVVGSSSFAAQGLVELLQRRGHEVCSLNRRPELALGHRGLAGNSTALANHAVTLQRCDVVLNYLVMKDATVETNVRFLQSLNELLIAIDCRRFIHLSSMSVLPAVSRTLNEKDDPPRNFRQKGAYARLKIAAEWWVTDHITHCELVLVRPGLIVGPGLPDPMVGIGKLLPTQRILGLGRRDSIIPVISREVLNEGISRLCEIPLPTRRTVVMFTAPNSPTRAEYLNFCCAEFGLGRSTLYLRPWAWRLSLALASLPLTLIKREWNNLPAKFRHNLKRRRYDSHATQQLLRLDLRTDWKRLFGDALEFQRRNFRLPPVFTGGPAAAQRRADPGLCYLGVGRIAFERHLPALRRLKYNGRLEWYDPFVETCPTGGCLNLQRSATPGEFKGSLAVVTTPVGPRAELLSQLPPGITEVLFEKPFAINTAQFSSLAAALGQRTAYVVHNYRFKPNVEWALQYLASHNPGQIYETRLHFDSPAVDSDKAAWMRDERKARTLLIDYAIHFLDLAWLLSEGEAKIQALEVARNLKQQTASIRARVKFANCDSCLLIRQGARQRRCQIEFVFSNYTLVLRFFPDAAVVFHGQSTFCDDFRLGMQGLAGVAKKVAEKIRILPAEPSHQKILGSFIGRYRRDQIAALSLENLRPFYSRLFALAEPVYGERLVSDGKSHAHDVPAGGFRTVTGAHVDGWTEREPELCTAGSQPQPAQKTSPA